MEKPKSVTYGIRLLYISASLFTGSFLFAFGSSGMQVTDLLLVVILPASITFYLIYLLSKGRFWIRSILLAVVIIDLFKIFTGMHFFVGQFVWLMILVLLLAITALFYLYNKESNAWYARLLMQETTNRLTRKKNPNHLDNNLLS